MTSEPEDEPIRRRWLFWVGLPAVILGFAAFDLAMKGAPATRAARAFVAAARAGRDDEMRRHATRALAARLEHPAPESPLARTLGFVRATDEIHGGFKGEWTHGCIEGSVGETNLWFLLVKEEGEWRVDDLRPDPRPRECEFDE